MQREHSVENFKITLHLRHATHAHTTINFKLIAVCVYMQNASVTSIMKTSKKENKDFSKKDRNTTEPS